MDQKAMMKAAAERMLSPEAETQMRQQAQMIRALSPDEVRRRMPQMANMTVRPQ